MQGILPLRKRSAGAHEPYDRVVRPHNEGSPRVRSREPRRLPQLAQTAHVGAECGAVLHRGFSPQQCLPTRWVKSQIGAPPPGLSPITENPTSPAPPSSEVTSDKGGPDSPASPHNTEVAAAEATHFPPWNEGAPMMKITPSAAPRSAPTHRVNSKRPQNTDKNDDKSRGKVVTRARRGEAAGSNSRWQGSCSPKELVAQATEDVSPWIGHSSEAETSDDHRAVEVEEPSHATPASMLTLNELSTIISSSGEPSELATGEGEASPDSENGPPDGLFSGPSQKWSSPEESPIDLTSQDDARGDNAETMLG